MEKVTFYLAKEIAPTINARDIVDEFEQRIGKANAPLVDLDFSNVEFVSRSAAHEFLLLKDELQNKLIRKKVVNFVNANKDVSEMLRVVNASRAYPRAKPQFEAQQVSAQVLFNDAT